PWGGLREWWDPSKENRSIRNHLLRHENHALLALSVPFSTTISRRPGTVELVRSYNLRFCPKYRISLTKNTGLWILSLPCGDAFIKGVGMSDLATHAKLARSCAQLPVNVYFDNALMQRELQQLFYKGPRYVGHELMVPEVGDFATLASENEGRMLVRNAGGI